MQSPAMLSATVTWLVMVVAGAEQDFLSHVAARLVQDGDNLQQSQTMQELEQVFAYGDKSRCAVRIKPVENSEGVHCSGSTRSWWT